MLRRFDQGVGTDRITAFSDGVFAIAITLLVLNLKVPDLPQDAPAADLLAALAEDLPNVQAYVVTFLVVGLFWMTHHRTFSFIRRYDGLLVWLNLLLLLCICVLPYPTAMLGRFSGAVPVMIYAANLSLVSLLQLTIWWYATRQHRLVDPDLSLMLIRLGTLRGLSTLGVFLASFAIAPFSAGAAMACWLLIPVPLILMTHVYHEKQVAEDCHVCQGDR
jgi:uncharacterized membrane protein